MTSVPQQRLQEMILSSCVKGHSEKMSDYGECGPVHRTTYGHFLSKGKWDDKRLEETQKRESFQTILELSRRKEAPLFVSIDDTVVRKSVPSSKAKRPTQGTGWHYSHLEGKVVYGYQVHAAIVGTGDSSLCYSLKRYCPDNGTKIDMTLDIIRSLPDDAGAYILMDSWYTNPGIFDACKGKNCHLIGAMKTNRILFPDGKRTAAADFAASRRAEKFSVNNAKKHLTKPFMGCCKILYDNEVDARRPARAPPFMLTRLGVYDMMTQQRLLFAARRQKHAE